MATFRKRGNKWSFRIDIGKDPITGNRKQLTVSKSKEYPEGFDNKTVKLAAATMLHELTRGTYIKEKDITFKELVEDWIKHYTNTVKVSTLRIRKYESGKLLTHFGIIKAKLITRKMYQEMLYAMKKEKLSDNYISGIHATGTMIFKYAMEYELIKANPTLSAKVPKTKKTVEQLENHVEVPKYLEKDELNVFLDVAKEQGFHGDYFIFLLLAYSGIRIGELCALKKNDFDTENNTLSITKTYNNPSSDVKKYELLTPKTKKSVRVIELSQIVFDELKIHLAHQNEIKMKFRKTYYDKGYVFANIDRYPGYPEYINKIEKHMSRLLEIAKLNEKLTPHSLRHTHTSLLAEAGVGLQEIMDRLGHEDDKTTKTVYLHVTKSMKKEAALKFDKLMEKQ